MSDLTWCYRWLHCKFFVRCYRWIFTCQGCFKTLWQPLEDSEFVQWMVIVVFLNCKEFRVFVLLAYNLLLFFAVIRPVVGPPLSRKKTDPVSRFEIFTLYIINFYQTFHFLKNKKCSCSYCTYISLPGITSLRMNGKQKKHLEKKATKIFAGMSG